MAVLRRVEEGKDDEGSGTIGFLRGGDHEFDNKKRGEETTKKSLKPDEELDDQDKTSYLFKSFHSDLVNGEALDAFISKHDLKAETVLNLYDFSQGQTSLEVNGKVYEIENLKHAEIYTEDATLYLDNGEEVPLRNEDSNIFSGEQNGDTVILVRDAVRANQVHSISIISSDQTEEVYMESIIPNVLAIVKSEDYRHQDFEDDEEEEDVDNSELVEDNFFSSAMSSDSLSASRSMLEESGNILVQRTKIKCQSITTVPVAIAYDSSFCSKFGSNAARSQAELIVQMASNLYRYQTCVALKVSKIVPKCNAQTDPFKGMINTWIKGGTAPLTKFTNWWRNNQSQTPAAAHLFFYKRTTNGKARGS